MNILAFDTCLDKMYVALGSDDKIIDTKIIETTNEHYHSAFLISTIKEIIKENGLKPTEIDVIATNIGPGSFTGIRACVTVARIFAHGINSKTVGVSSLEILSRLNKTSNPTLVALDARKETAYVAIYESGKEILAPQSMLLEELKNIINNKEYSIISDDKLLPILGGISYQTQDDNLGEFLLQITKEKLSTDFDTNWRKLLPLYIQPPSVSVKKPK